MTFRLSIVKIINLGKLTLLPSSQTNLMFVAFGFLLKKKLRVAFPSTKSAGKSEVVYFEIVVQFHNPLPWKLLLLLSPMGLLARGRCSPLPPDSHLFLKNSKNLTRIGIAIVYQVPMAKSIWPCTSIFPPQILYMFIYWKWAPQMPEHCILKLKR